MVQCLADLNIFGKDIYEVKINRSNKGRQIGVAWMIAGTNRPNLRWRYDYFRFFLTTRRTGTILAKALSR